jgi:hypothetical protein
VKGVGLELGMWINIDGEGGQRKLKNLGFLGSHVTPRRRSEGTAF